MLRVTSLLLVLISVFKHGSTDSSGVLYPYGEEEGDQITPIEDDGTSGEVQLSMEFKFFAKRYKSLHVRTLVFSIIFH
ncbi:hypothetical protein GDO81_021041 [Engystomops pustulosus]|uniref:Secreted protein n=1 Tax=Engystomops pustulosus TaxID=76066 RepID=A0AAV6YW21_ENGPU|nr:hypothetical protein GDO81_021041 [Engystomops pustulosus]